MSKKQKTVKRKHHEHSEVLKLFRELSREERQNAKLLREILHQLKPHHKSAFTAVATKTGEIDMSQTKLNAIPGSDVLTFNTGDVAGADITTRCTYKVTSSDPAVVAISPSTSASLPANQAAVVYAAGTCTLTIATVDSGGDTVPDVVLTVTIASPVVPGTTTVTAANATTVIG